MGERAATPESDISDPGVPGVRTAAAVTAAPLVSVLVPAYNHEQFIYRCLDSVLTDGYPNIELLIVNDGSQDATQQVAQDWIDQHGDKLRGGARLLQQQNRGVVKTLNRLVSEAKGEFVTVLASDDCLCQGSIGARVQYLQAHPRYLAVFGDAAGIDADDVVVANSVLEERYRASREALRCDATRGLELILRWSVPGPVYLARRTVANEIGPYDERYCFEDRNYYLRLIKADALGFIDRRVALYRIGSSRFTQLPDYDRVQEDLLRELHGLKRFALSLDVVLQRLRREEGSTYFLRAKKSILFRLRDRMIYYNRRVAAALLKKSPSSR